MSTHSLTQLPEDILLHCRSCNATRPSQPEELHHFIVDDDRWPRCCGMRLAIRFSHGHPEQVIESQA